MAYLWKKRTKPLINWGSRGAVHRWLYPVITYKSKNLTDPLLPFPLNKRGLEDAERRGTRDANTDLSEARTFLSLEVLWGIRVSLGSPWRSLLRLGYTAAPHPSLLGFQEHPPTLFQTSDGFLYFLFCLFIPRKICVSQCMYTCVCMCVRNNNNKKPNS